MHPAHRAFPANSVSASAAVGASAADGGSAVNGRGPAAAAAGARNGAPGPQHPTASLLWLCCCLPHVIHSAGALCYGPACKTAPGSHATAAPPSATNPVGQRALCDRHVTCAGHQADAAAANTAATYAGVSAPRGCAGGSARRPRLPHGWPVRPRAVASGMLMRPSSPARPCWRLRKLAAFSADRVLCLGHTWACLGYLASTTASCCPAGLPVVHRIDAAGRACRLPHMSDIPGWQCCGSKVRMCVTNFSLPLVRCSLSAPCACKNMRQRSLPPRYPPRLRALL